MTQILWYFGGIFLETISMPSENPNFFSSVVGEISLCIHQNVPIWNDHVFCARISASSRPDIGPVLFCTDSYTYWV